MADLTPTAAARDFLATFFGLGRGSSVTSHPPHRTLSASRAAYDECLRLGLVTEQPFNRHGSIEIRATDAGAAIAKARMHEKMEALANG